MVAGAVSTHCADTVKEYFIKRLFFNFVMRSVGIFNLLIELVFSFAKWFSNDGVDGFFEW